MMIAEKQVPEFVVQSPARRISVRVRDNQRLKAMLVVQVPFETAMVFGGSVAALHRSERLGCR